MTELLCERDCARTDETPHIATHGRYCTRCWGRLDMPLSQAGELAGHLVSMTLSTGGAGDDKVDSSKASPVPFNQAAFDDANELFSALVYWTAVWAEALALPTPPTDGWRTERGTIVGLPNGTTAEQANVAVTRLATWIRNRLDGILSLIDSADDIEAFTDQLGDVWRMNARWPRIEKPAYSDMPCPREDCGAKIAVYPPAFPGDARRVVCTAGHWYPEDEYEHLRLVFRQASKDKAKATKTAMRLAKKYGIGA